MKRVLYLLAILSILSGGAKAQLPDTLQEVVVTANREMMKRSEAPIAISVISSNTLKDTRATSVDHLLNKVSGVNMVSLGNEQHQMSIRQPITTKSLFLYLQDGIPIRTTGLFNHNALLEMNMAMVKRIEVLKGPSSSLYGSEAIGGVVNFITQTAPDSLDLRITWQGNNIGYKRLDLNSGFTSGKLGVVAGGYFAHKSNSYLEYTDFHKAALTLRADYSFSSRTSLSNNLTYVNYYSDMAGGVDSSMFATRKFVNPQTFTYRKVRSFRWHSSLNHQWNASAKTSMSLIFRDNSIGQNPAYRIKNDARKKDLAHGEINESSFNSYAFTAQHRQRLIRLRSLFIVGVSADRSPSRYHARYIAVVRDTAAKKYVAYHSPDSVLTNYETFIDNYASFLNFEWSATRSLRLVSSVRYDYFRYKLDNHLMPSSFSGAADTVNRFTRVSSKVGATYNFSSGKGIYANYSEGFIPPQVTEMYTGVKVPDLVPSVTRSYEAGGWLSLWRNKVVADLTYYHARSTNEVITVRLDDGSLANRNAGQTLHRGWEGGIRANPLRNVSVRLSGAYSKHHFAAYNEKGEDYSGREMSGAPRWTGNAELWYDYKTFRIGVEIQHVGRYFTDPANTHRYPGYTILNIRANYEYNGFEFWLNLLNATDCYYANFAAKSSFGYSYTLAEPLNINVGCTYNLSRIFKKDKYEK